MPLDSNGWDGSGSKIGDDCDDGDDTIILQAPEICDGQVNECGGSLPTDEVDDDDDGYVSVHWIPMVMESVQRVVVAMMEMIQLSFGTKLRWSSKRVWWFFTSGQIDNDNDGYVECTGT